MSAAGLPVGAVVRAHKALHAGLRSQRFKGGQIGFPQIPRRYLRVELVAQAFRAGMNGKMLGAARRFQVVGVVPLQALHKGHAQPGCQAGILAVGFLPPAPPGIPEQVHIRAPEGQALINVMIAVFLGFIVLGPSLGGDHLRDALHQFIVKAGRQPDCLRKHRGQSCPGHAVERLVPPVIAGDSQPFDGRGGIQRLPYAFLHGHLIHDFLSAAGNFRLPLFVMKGHKTGSFPYKPNGSWRFSRFCNFLYYTIKSSKMQDRFAKDCDILPEIRFPLDV